MLSIFLNLYKKALDLTSTYYEFKDSVSYNSLYILELFNNSLCLPDATILPLDTT